MSAETKEKEPEEIHISLIGRTPSNWVKKGTENDRNPILMDTSTMRMLKTVSYEKVWDETKKAWINRKLRFIFGADTIDFNEQELRKIIPNPQVDAGYLVLEGGEAKFYRTGFGVALCDYISRYHGNVNAPNRPDGAKDVFKVVKEEEIAEDQNAVFSEVAEAFGYLNTLMLRETGKGVTYRETEIDFLVNLFELGFIEGYGQKFRELTAKAQLNPVTFLNKIAEAKAAVVSTVNQAVAMKVVAFDASKAMFLPTSEVIKKMDTAKKDEQPGDLATFLLTRNGGKWHTKISAALQDAKEAATQVIK